MAKFTMKMVFDEDNSFGSLSTYKSVDLTFDVPNDMSLYDYSDLFKAFLVALAFPMDNKEVKIEDVVEEE